MKINRSDQMLPQMDSASGSVEIDAQELSAPQFDLSSPGEEDVGQEAETDSGFYTQEQPYYSPYADANSYFDGGLLQLIGWKIVGFLVTFFTLGICYPWALCMVYGWETKHTVINGQRLAFDGKAIQLFGNWIKWLLLCLITLGIYSFWLGISLKKWKVKHTYFAE